MKFLLAAIATVATVSAHQPIVWDNHPETPEARIARGNLNPYNSIRPEYRDAPPSHTDLEKIWQHHLQDHVYKSPFVRPMKSGLWEAGVPNRYAPGGYNRRKFKTEEEALLYVRHKTGAGMDVDYQAAKPSEKTAESFIQLGDEPEGKKEKKEDKAVEDPKQEKKGEKEGSLAKVRDEPEGKKEKKEDKAVAFIQVRGEPQEGGKKEKKDDQQEDPKKKQQQEGKGSLVQDKPLSQEEALEEGEVEPSPEDLENKEESLEAQAEKQLDRSDDEQEVRDHNLKIAHKIREFLANYNPNKPVHVVQGYGS